jgi:hypothetical protein
VVELEMQAVFVHPSAKARLTTPRVKASVLGEMVEALISGDMNACPLMTAIHARLLT